MSNFDPASGLVGGVLVDENDSIDQQGSIITADFLNGLQEEQTNLITLLGEAPTFGTNNQIATGLPGYIASLIAAQVRSPNHFVDPCCRVAQGAAPNLSVSKQYGAVDMVQAWASGGAVGAGTIAQDSTGAGGGVTPYSVHLAGVTLTGAGALSWRRWLDSADAQDYVNGPAIVACTITQDTGADIPNATITLNKANAANNFATTTLIGASGNLDVPNAQSKRISFYVANMGACGNGIEMIVTLPTGAIVTKDIYITDFQISPASVLAPFEVPRFGADYLGVQGWLSKSYEYGTAPGTVTTAGAIIAVVGGTGWANGGGNGTQMGASYVLQKRVTPAITIYNPNTGASGSIYDFQTAANKTVTATPDKNRFWLTNGSGGNIAAADILQIHYVADARL